MKRFSSIINISWPTLLLCLLLSACGQRDAGLGDPLLPSHSSTSGSDRAEEPMPPIPGRADVQDKRLSSRPARPLPGKPATIRAGVIGPAHRTTGGRDQAPSRSVIAQKERVLSFDQGPIAEVVDAVLGKEFGLEYALAPEVAGEMSLHIEGDYEADELLLLFAEALTVQGLDLVEREGLFVVRPMLAADGLELASPGTTGGAPQVVVYRLRYVDAEQAAKVIKGFLGKDRPLAAYPTTNTLIFAERPLATRRVVQLLRALDMNVLGEVGFEIVPLAAVPPQEAVNRLKEIISGVGQLKGSVVDDSTVFVPLERLPGVLVVSPHPEALQSVRQWLAALDVHTEAAGEQVMVYHMENGLAVKVAPILQELFASQGKGGGSTLATQAEPSRNVEPVVAASVAEGSDLSGLMAELSGKAQIIADEENNAMVVRANAADLARIREIIQTLDIMPRAVLIKMVIAEVELSDELRYGVEWFLRSNRSNFSGSVALDTGTSFARDFDLGDSASGLIPGGLSLFAGSIGTLDDFAALVNLLDAKNKVHILSTPTLLAMDNTKASFTVGGREPTISRVSKDAATDSSIVNDISYQDTGIILSVTPHINSSGLVRLEVDQRITNVNPQAVPGVNLNTPRFTERQLQTSLIAQSGSTMVIGGIIQQRSTNTRTGVPVLSDIPILSFFTSTTAKERERTELLIAVTPYVISHNSDPVSRELIDKLERMQRLIERDMAGE